MAADTPDTPWRQVPAQVDFPALEREMLTLWDEHDTFAKSLEQSAGGQPWTFFEGPPTANGMPGTHHIEARVFKDVFPRYRTMKGFWVERKAGWDCHGLPVEVAVEKELGFNGKNDIEAYGIAEFNAKCRASVLRHVDAFNELTVRMGYWVDLEHPYRTMDPEYVQSVWWSLKQVHDKGLLVEDYRITPYCPRCGTGLSDHELAQGYETVVDPSVYVRFPLTSGPLAGKASLLVWTTTPWTLVSNTAVAVHPDVQYVVATDGTESLVVAEPLLDKLGEGWTVTGQYGGREMERWTYQRPFELVEFPEPAHYVVLAEYVTTEDGTGLVHQSPAFGADDLAVSRAYNLPVVNPVDASGHFNADVPLVGGQFFKKADEDLVKDLAARGMLFKHVPYEHPYPHCWRCHTPVMYYALPSWYIRTTQVKDALLRENEKTNWYPDSVKWGRYGDWLRNNIDWAVSRSRYWGTPLPIWRCEDDHQVCVGSLAELGELAGTGPERDRSAPAVRRRHHLRLPDLWRRGSPRARGDRRLVRLGCDAVRAVGLPVGRGVEGEVRADVPGRLHLRGDRPDPWLVLHADGDRHAGLRRVVVPQRRLPRPHPGRGRPEDVQAPGQHPRADPADGRPQRGRGALVHGRVRLALEGARHRAERAERDRPEGAAHLLEHGRVPRPVRAAGRLVAHRRPGGRRALGAGPLAGERDAPAGPGHRRGVRGVRHAAARSADQLVRRRALELVRTPFPPPVLVR